MSALEQGAGQRRPYTKYGLIRVGASNVWLLRGTDESISCRGAAGLRPAPRHAPPILSQRMSLAVALFQGRHLFTLRDSPRTRSCPNYPNTAPTIWG